MAAAHPTCIVALSATPAAYVVTARWVTRNRWLLRSVTVECDEALAAELEIVVHPPRDAGPLTLAVMLDEPHAVLTQDARRLMSRAAAAGAPIAATPHTADLLLHSVLRGACRVPARASAG